MKLDACQAELVFKYKNIKTKLLLASENIRFNKKCLHENITPNLVSVKIRDHSISANRARVLAEKTWLKSEIKLSYARKSELNRQLYKTHLE